MSEVKNLLDNKAFMNHVRTPQNRGEMENPDVVAEVINDGCGDVTRFMLKVKDGLITDIMFDTSGCAATTSSCSMLTVMAKGKTIEEAKEITQDKVAEELQVSGLKMHCSRFAMQSFFKALEDYEAKEKKDGN